MALLAETTEIHNNTSRGSEIEKIEKMLVV